ncbi:uncharacterized protein LOC128953661 [Oppia nitens]|uniref:uncharacterized protein LOC128953661 n=1 Tax=Oppia nitens TaxID=1686743 RepID=UPI0023DA44B6|nr:uncharacterized protein LOC128953661 [Oppia nitens]
MSFTRNNVLLIGDSGVGKTSLVGQFCDNQFNDHQPATRGVAFRSVDYTYDGLHLKIAVWDSSALPQYRLVSRLYYTDVSAAIIVYDVTKRMTYERTNYWINTIREQSSILKYIIIVGNKTDLRDRFDGEHVGRQDGQQLANRQHTEFVECSAKFGLGVDQLFCRTFDGMIRRYVLTPILLASANNSSVRVKYKAIVLGDQGVGKSAIVDRLCGGHSAAAALSTGKSGQDLRGGGANGGGTQFQSAIAKVNKCSVELEFWDTSGQDSHRQSLADLMPMYSRSAHTVILVYDIQSRQSFDNLYGYLDLLTASGSESDGQNDCWPLVVLLGNKRDGKAGTGAATADRQVTTGEAVEFVENNMNIIGIFAEISANCDKSPAFAKLLTKICRNLLLSYPDNNNTSNSANSNIPVPNISGLMQPLKIKSKFTKHYKSCDIIVDNNNNNNRRKRLKNWFKCGSKSIDY